MSVFKGRAEPPSCRTASATRAAAGFFHISDDHMSASSGKRLAELGAQQTGASGDDCHAVAEREQLDRIRPGLWHAQSFSPSTLFPEPLPGMTGRMYPCSSSKATILCAFSAGGISTV